jgi:hypothetical protein
MSSQLDVYINNLPPFIGKYIFSFLIPDEDSVEFGDYRRTLRDNSGYCRRYEVAFNRNQLLENFRGMYLSRILKKNGKHRYYLTTEKHTHYCQGCGMEWCRSLYCRGGWEYEKYYESKYVGNDLTNALFKLLLDVDLPIKKMVKRIGTPDVERMDTTERVQELSGECSGIPGIYD